MKKISAGLIPFRWVNNEIEFLLAHPGGPFYKNKDQGAWSIVKGEVDGTEDLFETAKREFQEETGFDPAGTFIELGTIRQKSGKTVYAWAFDMNYDLKNGFICNQVSIEWPPKTGKFISIPEIDQLQYFTLEQASQKINEAQKAFLDRLTGILKSDQ